VDKSHLEIWSDLFDVLSTDEFSTFYHSLEHERFSNEEVIVKKGVVQTVLFFINSGRAKLYYRDKDREVLVKIMQSGQVMGAGSFFEPSVWTLSAAALGQTEISTLKLDTLQEWKEAFPSLESKLRDFCLRFESVDDFFLNSEKDRREHKRQNTKSLRLSMTLLDSKGQSTGANAKGELSDISQGGLSFFMRISKKENARLLLGRNLKIMLPIEETSGQPLDFTGMIVAVRAHHALENEYSVHVEFSAALDSPGFQQALRLISGA
jgi:CRP-like cAMP-binding protein